MEELISKRAVIEAIEKARANVGHNLERSIGKSIIEILDDVGMDVDRLPSALCTNLAEVGTDCISRQQAIDALENDKAALDKIIKGMSAEDMLLKYYVAQHNQVVYDIDAIVQLPPIQPDNNSETPNSSDTISRQQAIDALMSWVEEHKDNAFGGCLFHWTGIKALLENLPSVEPKRGKWIDKGVYTVVDDHRHLYECDRCGGGWLDTPKYCPNCGAKMEVTT